MTFAHYFAYGSNMHAERMSARVPSARALGPARLPGKRVVFNKRGLDGTAKANLVDDRGHTTWGVLYAIDPRDLDVLDRIEGGYHRCVRRVWRTEGEGVEAFVYISTRLVERPVARQWYKDLVVQGAREHQLPAAYVRYLGTLPAEPRAAVGHRSSTSGPPSGGGQASYHAASD